MFAASKTDSASTGDYQIQRSLRFNKDDNTYLNRTPASAGNRTTWTWSAWVKRTNLSDFQYNMFGAATDGSNYDEFRFTTADKFRFFIVSGAAIVLDLITTQLFRDSSAWYHLVVAYDSTQATSSNRAKFYVNGTQVTTFDTATYPAQNTNSNFNSNVPAYIGYSTSLFRLNSYMTEVNFIDGQALTPSSFGETNAQTGVWQPKAFSGGAYGTNGFYLNFSDNSNTTAATLGKDYSGNGNNWTPNNFSVSAGAGNDSMVDVPTPYGIDTGAGGTVRGNYATLNPLNAGNSAYLNNGNLAITNPSEANWRTGVSTIGVSTGKWYAEINVVNNALLIGIDKASVIFTGTTTFVGGSPTGWGILFTGQVYNNSGVVANNNSYVSGDVIGLAFDADAGTFTWYKNNVAMPYVVTGLTSGPYVLGLAASTSGDANINFGQRPFAYTAPSGFKALCTQNLPTPTIGATSTTLAEDYFGVSLWTGNSSTQTITNSGSFQPDWVWIKSRSSALYNHQLFDAVRGTNKVIYSNLTNAEFTDTDGLTAFNSNGFTMGGEAGINASGTTYVGWQWKANGSGVTNTSGSVTSTVSANTTSGFSVVTWTGSSAGQTVGHGLGVAPSLIIAKTRSASGENWPVYHKNLGIGTYLFLSSDAGSNTTYPTYWGSSAPTSTIFGTFTGGYPSANNYGSMVAYCFAPIAGYSEFGSYTGNGSTDGPFVFTGFRPAFVIIKVTSATNVWLMLDATRNTSNVVTLNLNANTSAAENTNSGWCDFTSNGFKVRGTDGAINTNSGTYIYMAFASNPFKYSLAR